MIYIIDNGVSYSGHSLHFVQAPKDFGAWFDGVLLPWLQLHALRGANMKIVATSPQVTWREKSATNTYQEFLGDDLSIEEFNYDESPAVRRPLYRGV